MQPLLCRVILDTDSTDAHQVAPRSTLDLPPHLGAWTVGSTDVVIHPRTTLFTTFFYNTAAPLARRAPLPLSSKMSLEPQHRKICFVEAQLR